MVEMNIEPVELSKESTKNMYLIKFKPSFNESEIEERENLIKTFENNFSQFIVNDKNKFFGIEYNIYSKGYSFVTDNIEKILENLTVFFKVDEISVNNINKCLY